MKKRRTIGGKIPAKTTKPAASKKDKRLIAAITKQVILSALVLGGLFAAVSFLHQQQAAEEKELSAAESEVRDLRNKTDGLTQQIDSLGVAAKIYTDLAGSRTNMQFTIDPLAIRPILAELKEKYYISTLNLEISPAAPFPLKGVQLENLEPSRFTASINVASLSDHFIYRFMDEMQERLPGVVRVQSASMKRLQPMTIEVLSRLSRGESVETMSGLIELNWYGFVETDGEEDAGGDS